LMDHGFQGKAGQQLPDLPDDFRVTVAERYIELYETITGTSFNPDTHSEPVNRVSDAISNFSLQ